MRHPTYQFVEELAAPWFNDPVAPPVDNAQLSEVLSHMGGAESSQRRLGEMITRFYRRLDALDITDLSDVTTEHCEGFIWATTDKGQAPSLHTVHLRRTALRALFKAVTSVVPDFVDPTIRIALPAKPELAGRPLDDNEIALIRVAALGATGGPLRTAAMFALSEACATTGEIARVLWADLDLDAGTVALPGATPVKPRIGELTDWAAGVLARHADAGTHGAIVAVGGDTADSHVAQASVVNTMRRVMSTAGVTGDGVKPGSVRLWAAQRQLHTGGVEAVARALGFDSLDRAADAIGYRWQDGDR